MTPIVLDRAVDKITATDHKMRHYFSAEAFFSPKFHLRRQFYELKQQSNVVPHKCVANIFDLLQSITWSRLSKHLEPLLVCVSTVSSYCSIISQDMGRIFTVSTVCRYCVLQESSLLPVVRQQLFLFRDCDIFFFKRCYIKI